MILKGDGRANQIARASKRCGTSKINQCSCSEHEGEDVRQRDLYEDVDEVRDHVCGQVDVVEGLHDVEHIVESRRAARRAQQQQHVQEQTPSALALHLTRRHHVGCSTQCVLVLLHGLGLRTTRGHRTSCGHRACNRQGRTKDRKPIKGPDESFTVSDTPPSQNAKLPRKVQESTEKQTRVSMRALL